MPILKLSVKIHYRITCAIHAHVVRSAVDRRHRLPPSRFQKKTLDKSSQYQLIL